MSLIKLTTRDTAKEDEQARIERLRRSYIESNKGVAKSIISTLREMAETNRKPYEAFLADFEISRVNSFIQLRDQRGKNLTIDEYNSPPKQNVGESRDDWQRRCNLQPTMDREIVIALTDHPSPSGENDTGYTEWVMKSNRPDFTIALKSNFKDIAAERAKKKVQIIVEQFVFKTLDKLIDILIKKPVYTAKLQHNSYSSGVLEADIGIVFADGTGFRTHLIIKTNYRFGRPFMQYPLTFHDVFLTQKQSCKAESQHQIMLAWGIPHWQAPPRQGGKRARRWDTVKTNCIVLTKGRLALVERITVPKESKAQVKEWNQKLEKLEEAYERRDIGDRKSHEAFTAYHDFKYKELPELKLSLMKAFVLYADGTRGIIDRNDITKIAAKIDSASSEFFYHDDVNKNPAEATLGKTYVEYDDGTAARMVFAGTRSPDLKAWTENGYMLNERRLRQWSFEIVEKGYAIPESDEQEEIAEPIVPA
jgi:hypothetical protein